jgi:hypothetical protein
LRQLDAWTDDSNTRAGDHEVRRSRHKGESRRTPAHNLLAS